MCLSFILLFMFYVLHTVLWQRSGWSWGTDGCCQTRFETGKFHQNFSFWVSILLLVIGTVKNIHVVTAYCFVILFFFLQSKERGSTQAVSLHDELTNSKVNIYKLYLINNPLRNVNFQIYFAQLLLDALLESHSFVYMQTWHYLKNTLSVLLCWVLTLCNIYNIFIYYMFTFSSLIQQCSFILS